MNVYDISMYCKIQVLFPPHCPCYDVPKARNFRYFYAVADCAGLNAVVCNDKELTASEQSHVLPFRDRDVMMTLFIIQ